jgi:hypothetical protein
LGAVAAALLIAAPAAGAATLLGQLPGGDSPDDCVENASAAQSSVAAGTPYAAPSDGVVTAWAHWGDSGTPGSGRLVVWRHVGGTSYTVVGRSDTAAFSPGSVNVFTTRIPVAAGDVIGLHADTAVVSCFFSGMAGDAIDTGLGNPAPGETLDLATPIPDRRLNLAANLEPDADCDGFGDETQDGSINPLGCDKEAPVTTITSGPAPKTRQRNATFAFVSSEPGSSFQCQLDGGAFVHCGSPFGLLKVKKGSHTFAVRSKDLAGNVEQTPATLTWLVKKKKKKKKHHHQHHN